MHMHKRTGLLTLAGLALAFLSACGGSSSSNTTIPSVVTTFDAHSAIFGNNSTVMTSGYNAFGQLGLGNRDNQTRFQTVPNLPKVLGFATGAVHTLAFRNISSQSVVLAWGSNYHGQLGSSSIVTTGTQAFSASPVRVATLAGVTSIAAGGFHSLAVAGGKIFGWGYNAYGQVGDGTFVDQTVPKEMSQQVAGAPVSNATSVAAGGGHSLALLASGRVLSWGNNDYGQLGRNPANGTFATLPDFVQSAGGAPLDNVKQIAAAGSYTVVLKNDGTVWALGYNGDGQLGMSPSVIPVFNPVQITFPLDVLPSGVTVVEISAGLNHVLARLSNGTIAAWGSNFYGQVGNNDNRVNLNDVSIGDKTKISTPVLVKVGGSPETPGSGSTMTGVTRIIAFGNYSLALSGGVWYGWGDNGSGQLGRPISTSSIGYLLVPQQVQF